MLAFHLCMTSFAVTDVRVQCVCRDIVGEAWTEMWASEGMNALRWPSLKGRPCFRRTSAEPSCVQRQACDGKRGLIFQGPVRGKRDPLC